MLYISWYVLLIWQRPTWLIHYFMSIILCRPLNTVTLSRRDLTDIDPPVPRQISPLKQTQRKPPKQTQVPQRSYTHTTQKQPQTRTPKSHLPKPKPKPTPNPKPHLPSTTTTPNPNPNAQPQTKTIHHFPRGTHSQPSRCSSRFHPSQNNGGGGGVRG